MGFKPDINACTLHGFKYFNINADAYCQSIPSKFTKSPIFLKGPSVNVLVPSWLGSIAYMFETLKPHVQCSVCIVSSKSIDLKTALLAVFHGTLLFSFSVNRHLLIWHGLRCCRDVGAICQQKSGASKDAQKLVPAQIDRWNIRFPNLYDML